MGPQHPSTHGVLRLVLELEGETVTQARSVIGYLHTGIEKNCEYRTWTQGVTFVTRMDYLAPIFNETAYCLARREAARRGGAAARAGGPGAAHGAQPDRLAPGVPRHRWHGARRADRHDRRVPRARGGAAPARVPHRPAHEPRVRPARRARPGPPGRLGGEGRRLHRGHAQRGCRTTTGCSPCSRSGASAWRRSATCRWTAASRSAPPGRSCARPGLPWDLRKVEPYCGYEEYDFEVPTATEADCYARFRLRVEEIHQSLQDHRAGRGEDGARPGHGRGSQDRVACAAVARLRRDGQHASSTSARSWVSRWSR